MNIHRIVAAAAAVSLVATVALAQGRHGEIRVHLKSPNYGRTNKTVPNRGVRLIRQNSQSACVQGRSWGFNRNRIWVNRGCEADFAYIPR